MTCKYDLEANLVEEIRKQSCRQFFVIIALIILFMASNIFWIYEFNQYDYVEIEADDGNASYINGNGDITNGKD
jgi:hypothetical protein